MGYSGAPPSSGIWSRLERPDEGEWSEKRLDGRTLGNTNLSNRVDG
jgi:hypothetical protein